LLYGPQDSRGARLAIKLRSSFAHGFDIPGLHPLTRSLLLCIDAAYRPDCLLLRWSLAAMPPNRGRIVTTPGNSMQKSSLLRTRFVSCRWSAEVRYRYRSSQGGKRLSGRGVGFATFTSWPLLEIGLASHVQNVIGHSAHVPIG
jgi:hypothetical protein